MVDPTPSSSAPARLVLSAVERRVLGTLIEKGMTTPEQYPLSLNALVNGCNQKSNRDPIVAYDEPTVDGALQSLIKRGLAANTTGFSGRVERYSSIVGRALELTSVEIAVLGELLLRGPQTEGELRIHASRMKPIADLETLGSILTKLRNFTPPLVARLTPEGVSRGVRWTHLCYSDRELERIRAEEAGRPAATEEVSPAAMDGAAPAEPGLAARVAALESRLDTLERKLADLLR
ncbi:MAG: DUF480 domain-containing protein [Planctomycetes bacterium]|nr:DUF480 domain-containing protein [Planctomycetota bacterium]